MSAARSQLLLPFAEREYVDVRRAAAILGVSIGSVVELYQAGKIDMIDYAKRKRKRVRYQSIVDFCDRLRIKYGIPDRRAPLSNPMLRHRDADVLPFPLSDTINVAGTMDILGYVSPKPVHDMITEGRFEGYHFLPNSPWRISRSSLADYLEQVHRASRLTNSHPLVSLQR